MKLGLEKGVFRVQIMLKLIFVHGVKGLNSPFLHMSNCPIDAC